MLFFVGCAGLKKLGDGHCRRTIAAPEGESRRNGRSYRSCTSRVGGDASINFTRQQAEGESRWRGQIKIYVGVAVVVRGDEWREMGKRGREKRCR